MANNSNNKKFNDSFKAKSSKSGSSDARIDFLKEGTDFLTDIEAEEDESEVLLPEDFNDPDLMDFDDETDSEQDFSTAEEITEEIKENITGKITVISRQVPIKKPVEKEEVEKEVTKLVKDLLTDIPDSEVTNFLKNTANHRDQLLNGEMQFLSRKNVSQEDKKEFMTKLDEIVSTEEVSKANSAFVLKWLNNRSNS